MMHSHLFRAGLAAVAWACAGLAQAVPLHIIFDDFTYRGSVTRYATLADAQNQVNPVGGPYTIATVTNGSHQTRPDARDGLISVTDTAPGYGADLTHVSTAWYFTTVIASGNGALNPNNVNHGFIQYYQDSTPTVSGGWQPGHTQFRLTVAGGDGNEWGDARFWPAPENAGSEAISYGKFITFTLDVVADFASPATPNGVTGWYETVAMPSAFSGTLRGIFENDQLDDPVHNGFYRFDYTVTGPGSWVSDSGAVWSDSVDEYPPESFWAAPRAVQVVAAPVMVPGPGKFALFGLALALAFVAVLRKRA